MSATATRLERVALRCDGLDATTARLRLDQLLAAADLRPPGLPPAALLYIRRLSDPLPGTLAIGGGQVRPPPEWERAFVAALEQLMRAAARPALEAVPAGAEAVLFADRAELLACLARDVCDGTAWTRWWWRSIRARARGTPGAAAEIWLAEPAYCPAALELLAARSAAARFARTLSAAAATELAARAASAFAAPALRAAVVADLSGRQREARRDRHHSSQSPPWRETAPEAAEPSLTSAHKLVLGVLLTLRRAPAVGRSPGFATGVESWRARQTEDAAADSVPRLRLEPVTVAAAVEVAATPATSRDRPPPISVRAAASDASARDEPLRPHAADHAVDPAGDLRDRVARAAVPADESLAAAADGSATVANPAAPDFPPPPATDRLQAPAPVFEELPSSPEPAAPTAPRAPSPGPRRRPATQRERRPRLGPPPVPEPRRAPSAAPQPDRLQPLAVAVDTDLGGIFYLLNLALHLELYGDFTVPLQPGIGLHPWDFIELLGSWLLGRRDDDPIWGLLAGLAGRDREPAGGGFRPPRRWRVPPGWLEPITCDGVWRWSAADRTLRILHPAGFLVTAVPRTTAAPGAQLRAELRRLPGRQPRLVRAALGREPKDPLARWMARFGPYARIRLARSLGLADPVQVADVLLSHRARVLVSPTHVDVHFALAELPLAIRFAGLDRTPGWIPAAGHFVAFEFA